MTPAVARFLRRIRAKAATMQPQVSRAYLAGINALAASLSGRELEALAASGAVEQYIGLALSDANLNAAFSKYRTQVQLTTRETVSWFGKDIPGVAAFVRGGGGGIAFDHLNPRVIDAVRALDSTVMTRLKTEVRETVRAIVENGLRDGAGPRQTSKAIREMIGMGKTQVQEARNFKAALEAGNLGKVQGYAARNRVLDSMISHGTLTPERIEKAYRDYLSRRIAINAATTARTATLESFRAGQKLSWEDAIDKGIVERGRLRREWVAVMDGRTRHEHEIMNGAVTGFDEPFQNGDMIVGESSPWNCRCSERVYIGRD